MSDAKNYLVKRARRNPLHWQEPIKRELKKLLHMEVIEKALAGAVFFYISPSHWNKVDPADTYFTVSDLAAGYHQICIPESDAHPFGILLKDGINRYVNTVSCLFSFSRLVSCAAFLSQSIL